MAAKHGIQVIRSRKSGRTTDRDHAFRIAPKFLQQDFTASGPNRTREGWVCLAVIIDPSGENSPPDCFLILVDLEARGGLGDRQPHEAGSRLAGAEQGDRNPKATTGVRPAHPGRWRSGPHVITRTAGRNSAPTMARNYRAGMGSGFRCAARAIVTTIPPPLGRFALQIACRATVESVLESLKADAIGPLQPEQGRMVLCGLSAKPMGRGAIQARRVKPRARWLRTSQIIATPGSSDRQVMAMTMP